jgi:hypothetical protein
MKEEIFEDSVEVTTELEDDSESVEDEAGASEEPSPGVVYKRQPNGQLVPE